MCNEKNGSNESTLHKIIIEKKIKGEENPQQRYEKDGY